MINNGTRYASAMLVGPAIKAVKRLSISSIRMSRARPIPSASRTAISPRRTMARERNNMVTLLQANSSTRKSGPRIKAISVKVRS